jgi:hypothetical protein
MKNNIELAEQLFNKIQTFQGYAFISDGITGLNLSDEEVLEIAKTSLYWTNKTVRTLRKFIKDIKNKK